MKKNVVVIRVNQENLMKRTAGLHADFTALIVRPRQQFSRFLVIKFIPMYMSKLIQFQLINQKFIVWDICIVSSVLYALF